MTFHQPSVMCDRHGKSLPSRFVALKGIAGLPNMSGSMVMLSIALIKVSVDRFVPVFCAALANVSIKEQPFTEKTVASSFNFVLYLFAQKRIGCEASSR